ncbi:MAG: histidine kinase [Bacteroidales bacterium]|jgi:two-component system LytT family sensor kinase|nr:histidine kinase [Bacteroidales bacterium]
MKRSNYRKIIEISFLILFVFGFRVLIEEATPLFEKQLNLSFGRFVMKLLGNYPVTFFMLFVDISLAYLINKYIKSENSFKKFIGIVSTAFFVAFFSALWIRIPVWNKGTETILFQDIYFNLTVLTSFVLNLVIISFIQVYLYYVKSHEKALNIEIGKKTRAQYQYQQLKRQLNPHFLFNSLNVLDFLIYTNQERASDFVKKLSSLYRYLLNTEDLKSVPLKEELDFVLLYYSLMKERFSDGLDLTINIEPNKINHHIIPGGLQLLVENAAKHNIVCAEIPLQIDISTEQNYIVVRNNINLKINTIDSGGIGLKNIKGQYKLLFKKDIHITSDDNFFCVKIPLIEI